MIELIAARTSRPGRPALFVSFFCAEVIVFLILPLSSIVPVNTLLYIHAIVTGVLLVTALLARRSESFRRYWPIAYAFFVAAAAVLLGVLLSDRVLPLLRLTAATPQGMAVAKLSESIWRTATILTLAALAGADRRSLYLNKGHLGVALAIGAVAFVVLAALAFLPLARQPGMVDRLIALSPWILTFVLANGFTEELLFRGLFLRQYELFLGKRWSNVLVASVFTLLHLQVTYVPQMLQFLLVLAPLAWIWGYLMQRTDSLWGSALFHAGADCLIVLGVFATAC